MPAARNKESPGFCLPPGVALWPRPRSGFIPAEAEWLCVPVKCSRRAVLLAAPQASLARKRFHGSGLVTLSAEFPAWRESFAAEAADEDLLDFAFPGGFFWPCFDPRGTRRSTLLFFRIVAPPPFSGPWRGVGFCRPRKFPSSS